jgi:hemoglobin-like flavoprotein
MAETEDMVVDEEFEAELDKVGSARGKLRRKMIDEDPELAKVFNEQTPAQRAWGKMLGKLILATSNDEVEAAFMWGAAEINEGRELKPVEKITALFHAMGSLGADDAHYRIIRRMYIKAKTND